MILHTQAVNEVGDRTNASRFCRIRVTKFNRAKLSACVGVNCLFRSMTSFEKKEEDLQIDRRFVVLLLSTLDHRSVVASLEMIPVTKKEQKP